MKFLQFQKVLKLLLNEKLNKLLTKSMYLNSCNFALNIVLEFLDQPNSGL